MYHTQITSAYSDLVAVTTEINKVTSLADKKLRNIEFLSDVEKGIINASPNQISQINFEMEMLPEVTVNMKSNLLELKSRMRERLFKMMQELARLHGVYSSDITWTKAVEILLDQEMVSPELAKNILEQVDK
jgi:hypothetical protein